MKTRHIILIGILTGTATALLFFGIKNGKKPPLQTKATDNTTLLYTNTNTQDHTVNYTSRTDNNSTITIIYNPIKSSYIATTTTENNETTTNYKWQMELHFYFILKVNNINYYGYSDTNKTKFTQTIENQPTTIIQEDNTEYFLRIWRISNQASAFEYQINLGQNSTFTTQFTFTTIKWFQNNNTYNQNLSTSYAPLLEASGGTSILNETLTINSDYYTGYESGYNQGQQEGYTTGYNTGYTTGYNTGSQEGREQGYSTGHINGYIEGQSAGYTAGETAGYNTGYTAGETAGYNTGYTEGYQQAIAETDTEAIYQQGYNTGYGIGYNDSEAFNHPIDFAPMMLNILTMPFTFISQAFDVTLWPGTEYQINIGNFIKAMIAISAILFIIRLFTSGFSIIGNYTTNINKEAKMRSDNRKSKQAWKSQKIVEKGAKQANKE